MGSGLVGITVLVHTPDVKAIELERKGSVIVGDSQAFIEHEGLAPTVQPLENGMRVSSMLDSFEFFSAP